MENEKWMKKEKLAKRNGKEKWTKRIMKYEKKKLPRLYESLF